VPGHRAHHRERPDYRGTALRSAAERVSCRFRARRVTPRVSAPGAHIAQICVHCEEVIMSAQAVIE